MFAFLRKRIRKEHMKVVAQNYKALAYLFASCRLLQASSFQSFCSV
jgi:hypothetical protein